MGTPSPPSLDAVRELLRAGRDEEAISALQALNHAGPADHEVLLQLGLAYNRTGARQEAVVALKRASQLQPDAPLPWTGIGIAYGCMNQHARAVEALQTAIRLGDHSGHAHHNLARALALVGRSAEAIAIARTARARLPGHDEAAFGVVLALRAWARDLANPAPHRAQSEAEAEARAFLADYPHSVCAAEARALLAADAHAAARGALPLRADVLTLLRRAMHEFDLMHRQAGTRRAIASVVFELTMLLRAGTDFTDPRAEHLLQTLPGRSYSGPELAAYLYAGARKLTIEVDFGIDYAAEYEHLRREAEASGG